MREFSGERQAHAPEGLHDASCCAYSFFFRVWRYLTNADKKERLQRDDQKYGDIDETMQWFEDMSNPKAAAERKIKRLREMGYDGDFSELTNYKALQELLSSK